MTIDDIDQQIAAITEKLHGDARECRPPKGEPGIERPVFRTVKETVDGEERLVEKQVGTSTETADAEAIRAERAALKSTRSRLRKLRAALELADEAKVAPRAREDILAELAELRAQKLAIVERSKLVARELARRETADELAAMPPAKRAALAQMLEAERIASTAKMHTPGAKG